MSNANTPSGDGSGPARAVPPPTRAAVGAAHAAPRAAYRFSAKLALQRAFVAAPTD